MCELGLMYLFYQVTFSHFAGAKLCRVIDIDISDISDISEMLFSELKTILNYIIGVVDWDNTVVE